eukprot:3668669-Rhodomonas_salina.3
MQSSHCCPVAVWNTATTCHHASQARFPVPSLVPGSSANVEPVTVPDPDVPVSSVPCRANSRDYVVVYCVYWSADTKTQVTQG